MENALETTGLVLLTGFLIALWLFYIWILFESLIIMGVNAVKGNEGEWFHDIYFNRLKYRFFYLYRKVRTLSITWPKKNNGYLINNEEDFYWFQRLQELQSRKKIEATNQPERYPCVVYSINLFLHGSGSYKATYNFSYEEILAWPFIQDGKTINVFMTPEEKESYMNLLAKKVDDYFFSVNSQATGYPNEENFEIEPEGSYVWETPSAPVNESWEDKEADAVQKPVSGLYVSGKPPSF